MGNSSPVMLPSFIMSPGSNVLLQLEYDKKTKYQISGIGLKFCR
jgi:hypothetical protein